MIEIERIRIRGVDFDNVTMEEAVNKVLGFIKGDKTCLVVTPNSEIVQMCIENQEINKLINSADLCIPDGIGVVYASKILHKPLKQKVAGFDLAAALLPVLEENGTRLFLFGAAPGVAETAAEKMKEKHKNLNICGMANGYFKDEAPIIESINNSGAEVVFVCIGAPKQEQFMARNKDKITAKVMLGLGGSLDVFAGNVQRAPDIYIRLGLEWFYRLIKQPKRIGRMMKLPKFLFGTILVSITGKE